MQYQIDLKPCAARDLSRLARDVQKRVSVSIDSLKENPRSVGFKKLKLSLHNQHLYRIRVGHYRIIYQIDDKTHVVLVVTIQHRREDYRNI
jgi:mRNA interferase RelE/StbE